MDKLTMAHDWAMKHGKSETIWDREKAVEYAWEYADAMEAEADKRALQKRAELRELLNHPNTFVEKEGQHFDDVEFEVDWSQAPDWANWWVCTSNNRNSVWVNCKPFISSLTDSWNLELLKREKSPSFGYTGDWRNSLRKRPEMEVVRNG